MRLWSVIFLTVLWANLSGVRAASPDQFTCLPSKWYSGGFDVFQIEKKFNPNGHQSFIGKRFWQMTSGHGFVMHKEIVLREEVELVVEENDGELFLRGFHSSFESPPEIPLVVSLSWEESAASRAPARSPLFRNDLWVETGVCVAGDVSILKKCRQGGLENCLAL